MNTVKADCPLQTKLGLTMDLRKDLGLLLVWSSSFAETLNRVGSDKSRGNCLQMICADLLAGANLETDDPGVLLQSALQFFKFLPGEERKVFLDSIAEKAA